MQIHAEIRPDVFVSGTTKYTACELAGLLKQEEKPIYIAVDQDDVCMGYAFCQMQEQPFSTNMVPFKSLFIDDLCVDQQARGRHIGESLFEYVKQQAKEQGCYEVTLNVLGQETPRQSTFYDKKMGMKNKGTADGIYPVNRAAFFVVPNPPIIEKTTVSSWLFQGSAGSAHKILHGLHRVLPRGSLPGEHHTGSTV